jgi:type II pantothenate kinase
VDAISHPGAVRINVQGAFIVDEENGPSTPSSERSSETSMSLKELEDGGYEHDGKDIRLPNHTQGVSHIAVDVSNEPLSMFQVEGHASSIFEDMEHMVKLLGLS